MFLSRIFQILVSNSSIAELDPFKFKFKKTKTRTMKFVISRKAKVEQLQTSLPVPPSAISAIFLTALLPFITALPSSVPSHHHSLRLPLPTNNPFSFYLSPTKCSKPNALSRSQATTCATLSGRYLSQAPHPRLRAYLHLQFATRSPIISHNRNTSNPNRRPQHHRPMQSASYCACDRSQITKNKPLKNHAYFLQSMTQSSKSAHLTQRNTP